MTRCSTHRSPGVAGFDPDCLQLSKALPDRILINVVKDDCAFSGLLMLESHLKLTALRSNLRRYMTESLC